MGATQEPGGESESMNKTEEQGNQETRSVGDRRLRAVYKGT